MKQTLLEMFIQNIHVCLLVACVLVGDCRQLKVKTTRQALFLPELLILKVVKRQCKRFALFQVAGVFQRAICKKPGSTSERGVSAVPCFRCYALGMIDDQCEKCFLLCVYFDIVCWRRIPVHPSSRLRIALMETSVAAQVLGGIFAVYRAQVKELNVHDCFLYWEIDKSMSSWFT